MQYEYAILDIKAIREEIGLSQSEFADLLSVSPRTVQSCEQGWRNPSSSLEKSALLILMAHRNGSEFGKKTCWKVIKCDPEYRKSCIIFQSRQGHLCWLMSGTTCRGIRLKSWRDKLALCVQCEFFQALLPGKLPVLR